MITHCQSHVGKQRSENQDAARCLSIDNGGELIIVADGMGGHPNGAEASTTAVDRLAKAVTSLDVTDVQPKTVLEDGFHSAHRAVTDLATESNGAPGTTLVAALVREGTATIANVGDSRAYCVGENLRQITRDHTPVQELVETGEITPEEAEDHPMGHVLSQAVGTADDLSVDLYAQSLSDDDLLLCTDGLTNPVPDDLIEETYQEASSLKQASTNLIRTANDQGGPDNVTVGLCRLTEY